MSSVLVIEDNVVTVQTFVILLRNEGFNVATARTGREGVERGARSPFDAILVDLNLPDMSGLEVVQALRARSVLSPIVIVTAFPHLDSSFDAGAAGASGYVDGPLFGDELLIVVRNAIQGRLPVRHPSRSVWELTPHSEFSTLGQTDPRVRDAVRHIESAPYVSVQALASAVGLSESRLRHLFRLSTGVSISRFVSGRRLHLAARLLATGYQHITDIARGVGATDGRQFRRAFRHMFGMSPTEYRKRFQQNRDASHAKRRRDRRLEPESET